MVATQIRRGPVAVNSMRGRAHGGEQVFELLFVDEVLLRADDGQVDAVHQDFGEVDQRCHRTGDRAEAEPDGGVEGTGVRPGHAVEVGSGGEGV